MLLASAHGTSLRELVHNPTGIAERLRAMTKKKGQWEDIKWPYHWESWGTPAECIPVHLGSGYPRWPGIVVKPLPKSEILQGHHLTGEGAIAPSATLSPAFHSSLETHAEGAIAPSVLKT